MTVSIKPLVGRQLLIIYLFAAVLILLVTVIKLLVVSLGWFRQQKDVGAFFTAIDLEPCLVVPEKGFDQLKFPAAAKVTLVQLD